MENRLNTYMNPHLLDMASSQGHEHYSNLVSVTGSGRLLMCFFTYSKQEKKIMLMVQDRAMETPSPKQGPI